MVERLTKIFGRMKWVTWKKLLNESVVVK
jgi:hypothetical protein